MPIALNRAVNFLNAEFGADTFTSVSSFWIGFRSAGVELTNGNSPGYARSEVVNDGTNWPATSSNTIANGTDITTPPTGNASGNWLEADEVVVYDAETSGNLLYSGLLDQPFSMLTGQKRSFAPGAFQVRAI